MALTLQEHNKFWDEQIKKIGDYAQTAKDALIAKCNKEKRYYENFLQENIPLAPKKSPKIFELEELEQLFINHEMYHEANGVYKRIL